MKKYSVLSTISAVFCLSLWVACGQPAESIDAGPGDDVQIVITDSGTPDNNRPDTRMPDSFVADTHQPDNFVADTHQADTVVADTTTADDVTTTSDAVTADDTTSADDIVVINDATTVHDSATNDDATTADDVTTATDAISVDAVNTLACSEALMCALQNCSDGNRTCIEACGEAVCPNDVALWNALFTCIDSNCAVACADSLFASGCVTCRQTYCQAAYTACGSSSICQ